MQGEEALPSASHWFAVSLGFHSGDIASKGGILKTETRLLGHQGSSQGGLAHGTVVVRNRPMNREPRDTGDIVRIDGERTLRTADHEPYLAFADTETDKFIHAPSSQVEGKYLRRRDQIDRIREFEKVS